MQVVDYRSLAGVPPGGTPPKSICIRMEELKSILGLEAIDGEIESERLSAVLLRLLCGHPSRLVRLSASSQRESALRHILGDATAGCDIRSGAQRYRSDQGRVRAYEHAIADGGLVLVDAVVVARDRSRAYVHPGADRLRCPDSSDGWPSILCPASSSWSRRSCRHVRLRRSGSPAAGARRVQGSRRSPLQPCRGCSRCAR